MNINTDTEVILMALQKERHELHERIMQIDRIIGRVRTINYNVDDIAIDKQDRIEDKSNDEQKAIIFPKTADIKIQVLRIFDIVNKASSLSDLQAEFTKASGNRYNIREAVRSLQHTGILKLLKFKNASRGFLWVKTEWIENDMLMDKYKPIGFDLLYKPENLMFQ